MVLAVLASTKKTFQKLETNRVYQFSVAKSNQKITPPARPSNLTLFDKLEGTLAFPRSTEPVQDKHALFSRGK
jgi:hypothetical protein